MEIDLSRFIACTADFNPVLFIIRSCTDVLEMEVVATEDIQDARNQVASYFIFSLVVLCNSQFDIFVRADLCRSLPFMCAHLLVSPQDF